MALEEPAARKNPLNFKYIIIGDAGVGKTSLLHYFIFNKFKKDPKQTVNVEYSSKKLSIADREILLQLWDTAGQERYKSVTKSYYKNALGVIIVYDITKQESFQNVQNWLNDAKPIAKPNCTICVVGNKSDLKEERAVQFNEAAKFCQDNELKFFECSALTGENIEEVFLQTASSINKKIENGLIELENNKLGVTLDPKNEDNKAENNQKCSYC